MAGDIEDLNIEKLKEAAEAQSRNFFLGLHPHARPPPRRKIPTLPTRPSGRVAKYSTLIGRDPRAHAMKIRQTAHPRRLFARLGKSAGTSRVEKSPYALTAKNSN